MHTITETEFFVQLRDYVGSHLPDLATTYIQDATGLDATKTKGACFLVCYFSPFHPGINVIGSHFCASCLNTFYMHTVYKSLALLTTEI